MGVFFAGLLGVLKAKAAGITIGAGLTGLFFLAKRQIPKMVGSYTAKYLGKLLDVKDYDDQELVKSLVFWAEKKIPDKGKGKERYDMVAKKIVSLFPAMKPYEDSIETLIETSVIEMDKELKRASKGKGRIRLLD